VYVSEALCRHASSLWWSGGVDGLDFGSVRKSRAGLRRGDDLGPNLRIKSPLPMCCRPLAVLSKLRIVAGQSHDLTHQDLPLLFVILYRVRVESCRGLRAVFRLPNSFQTASQPCAAPPRPPKCS
jgi:hypothetical protein